MAEKIKSIIIKSIWICTYLIFQYTNVHVFNIICIVKIVLIRWKPSANSRPSFLKVFGIKFYFSFIVKFCSALPEATALKSVGQLAQSPLKCLWFWVEFVARFRRIIVQNLWKLFMKKWILWYYLRAKNG